MRPLHVPGCCRHAGSQGALILHGGSREGLWGLHGGHLPLLELSAVAGLAWVQRFQATCFLLTPQLQKPLCCQEREAFLAALLLKRMLITPNRSAAKTEGTAATWRHGTWLFQAD